MKKQRKGQSVLEYVIVLTAIIAVIIVVARGAITNGVTSMMSGAGTSITSAASRLPF